MSNLETRRTRSPRSGAGRAGVAAALAEWFGSESGRGLVAREAEPLTEGARRFHGDAMLWLGPVDFSHVELGRCMIRQRIFGASDHDTARRCEVSTYVGALESLPFAPASLDAVVLHHALECAADSRVAMAEVARALRPGGRVLICGFNPFSPWGVRPLWARLRPDAFAGVRFVSPLRLLDWLAVLGLEIDEPVRYLAYRTVFPEVDSWIRAVADRLQRWQFPFGSVYMVLAHKQAMAGIDAGAPVRRFGKRAGLVPTPLPRPTARHGA